MNRRQKIIISVTGIFLVLILLVGITYGYFMTKINGNENNKSISVSTANLELTYADGNGTIEATKVYPGTEIATKTFTVENTGNSKISSYVVMIENVVVTKNGYTIFDNPEDIVYTLNCTIYDSDDETKIGTSCNGKDSSSLPMGDSILVSNDIDANEKHLYKLTVEYLETYKDQTSDKDKNISFKLNVKNEKELNPYKEGTLTYNIVNNAYNNAVSNPTSTVVRGTTLTEIGMLSATSEKSLSYTQDKGGISYYYRGKVTDNYVNFAGMCWRIVRIASDGSTKLILENQTDVCGDGTSNWSLGSGAFGYELISATVASSNNSNDYSVPTLKYLNTTSMASIFKSFQSNKLSSYLNMLKSGDWCLADSAYTKNKQLISDKSSYYKNRTAFDYSSSKRMKNNEYTLDCDGTIMNDWGDNESNPTAMYVGGITIDELIYSGAGLPSSNDNIRSLNNYIVSNLWFWTMSPSEFTGNADGVFEVTGGAVLNQGVHGISNYRPVISLLPEIKVISGNGTLNSPYEVSM